MGGARMAGIEDDDEQLPSQQITLSLIDSQCLHHMDSDADENEKYEAMLNLSRLDLDRQRIGYISGLETFTSLRHLSLRANRIKHISGLASLSLLEVLGLGENQIESIEGLIHLKQL